MTFAARPRRADLRLPQGLRRDADRAGPRRRAHRRRLQRLRRLEQPGRLPRGVPGPPDQRRHRRAGPGRRRRRPGQRRHDPVRLRRRAVPDRPRAGADQGRRRLQPTPTSSCAARARAWPTASSARRTTRSRTSSWMRAIADLTVLVPADPAQTRAAVRWAVENPGPLLPAHPALQGPRGHARGRAARARPRDHAARRRRRHDHRDRHDGLARARRRRARCAPTASAPE